MPYPYNFGLFFESAVNAGGTTFKLIPKRKLNDKENDALSTIMQYLTHIDASQILAGSLSGLQLVDYSVGSTQIALNAVTNVSILNASIFEDKMADLAINIQHIVNGAITNIKIADGAVGNTKIAANSIEAMHIVANAVTAAAINVLSLGAISANIGTITAGTMTGVSVTGGDVVLNTDGLAIIGEKFDAQNAGGTSKGTIGYDSVNDRFRIISRDTTDLELEGNTNTVIITGGGRLGTIDPTTITIANVFQNTSDFLVLGTYTVVLAPGDSVSFLCDDSTPPTTVRARASNDALNGDDIRVPISMAIRNDEYYKINIVAGAPTLSAYHEIRLYGI